MNRTAVLDDRAALSRGHPLQSSTSSLSSVTGTLHDTISRPLAQWITAALTSSGLQHHLENAGSMDADSLIGTLATGELLCFAAKLEFHSRPSLYSQISNLSLLLHFCESNDIRTGWSPQQVVQGRQRLAFLATVFQLAHTLHEQEPTTLPPPPISPPPTLHDLQRAHSLPMCPGSDLPPRTDSVLLQSRSIDNSHVDLAPLVARVASLEQAQFQLIAAFQTADQSARASHAAVEKLTTALIDAFVDIQLLVSRQSDGGDSAIASNASLVPAARSTEPGFDAPSAASASSMALPTLVAPPLEAVAIPERGVTAMPQLDINVPVSALFDSDDYGLSTVTTAMAATPPPAQPTTAAAAASAQAAAATSLGHALAQLEAACLPPVTALDEDSMPMHTVLEQGSSSSNNNNKNTAAPQLNGRMRALSIASLPSMWSNATSADVETIATDKKSFFTTATQRSRRASPAAYDATSLADDSRSVYSLNSVGTARRSSVPAISSSRPASVRFGSTAPRPSGTSSSRVSVGSTDLAQLKAELHARLPESVLDAVSTKIELLRQAAIYELITTERSFANDLKVLWTDLCQWLQRAASNTGDTSEELRKIVVAVFPTSESVEHVLGCSALVMTSHQEILDVIQRELAQSRTGIIDSPERLLLQMIPHLHVHRAYAEHYHKTVTPLLASRQFAELSDRIQHLPFSNGQTLNSYLVKPIQRVLKYPLLVDQIKANSFENSPDYPLWDKIQSELQSLLDAVNSEGGPVFSPLARKIAATQVAQHGKQIRGFEDLGLPDTTLFIKDGMAHRASSSSSSSSSGSQNAGGARSLPVFLVLFSDALLVCKTGTISARRRHAVSIALSPCRIVAVPAAGNLSMPGLAMLDIIPTTDDYQVTGSSASGCLATPTTSSGGAGFGVVPDGENPRVGVTALSIGFETVDERSAWIRAIEKAANHQVSRGAHTAVSFRKVKIGSSLKNALGRLSDSRSGAMAAASSGMPGPMRMLSGSDLPVSTVSPHDMPDGVDFLVRTLAEHKPASQFEIGFHKHTYLRVLNDSRSDLWKVAISRVVGLVPRSLVARVEADPAQYQQLMAACRREGALSWIEYAGECDATLRPTAMVAGIQHQRQRSQIDLALANMDTPPLADTPLVGQSVGREPPRKSRKLLPSFGHKRSRSLGLSSASLATVNVLSDPSSAVGVQPRSSTPAPDGVRVEKVEGRHGWVRIHNANQSRPYFHNESKKLTVWELPAESAADEEDL